MNILLLMDGIVPESRGGAEVVVWSLAQALVRAGNKVSIITTTRKRENEGYREAEGVAIHTICSNYPARFRAYVSLYNPQTVGKVKELIGRIKPEVVHAHNVHHYLSYHSLKIAKKSGAKVYLTAHDVMLFHYGKFTEFIDASHPTCEVTSYHISAWRQFMVYKTRYNPLRNIIIKHYLRYVDRIFAVSDALKEVLTQNGIGKIDVIHNAITPSEWQVDASEVEKFKTKFSLQGKKVVLFGGRLGGRKGAFQAIEAMQKVIECLPKTKLLVVGEKNAYAETILEQAKQVGIGESLIFTGWIEGSERTAAYHASDLIIMPSICFDTFGMVCLEAMAAHKPVIATCFGGPKEVVAHGKTGYIVNPFAIDTMAEKIVDLLNDPIKAQLFGEAGYARAKEQFAITDQIEETLRCYQR